MYKKLIQQRIKNKNCTFIAIIGPCSIYNEEETLLYENKLKLLQKELGNTILLVMRAFVEKSRTSHAWRGFVYQPDLSKRENILCGIKRTKNLFSKMTTPLAMEFIDPSIYPHLSSYISWGFIGARTSTSTTHRILVSDADTPFGFKNSLDSNIISAIHSCLVSKHSHCFLEKHTQKYTRGNPYTHVVLRGGSGGINYDINTLDKVYHLSKKHNLNIPILVDCSHGNCPNKPDDQKIAFAHTLEQYIKNPKKILGVMLESNVHKGASSKLKIPGISFTDPCLSFEETRSLLLDAKEQIIRRHHKEELNLPTSYEYSH